MLLLGCAASPFHSFCQHQAPCHNKFGPAKIHLLSHVPFAIFFATFKRLYTLQCANAVLNFCGCCRLQSTSLCSVLLSCSLQFPHGACRILRGPLIIGGGKRSESSCQGTCPFSMPKASFWDWRVVAKSCTLPLCSSKVVQSTKRLVHSCQAALRALLRNPSLKEALRNPKQVRALPFMPVGFREAPRSRAAGFRIPQALHPQGPWLGCQWVARQFHRQKPPFAGGNDTLPVELAHSSSSR